MGQSKLETPSTARNHQAPAQSSLFLPQDVTQASSPRGRHPGGPHPAITRGLRAPPLGEGGGLHVLRPA